MNVEVVVPWRGGCAHRESAWQWCGEQWAELGWAVTLAEAAPGPWCKASAVTPAVEASAAEIIVLADADVWTTGVPAAVDAIERDSAWAVPHRLVHRLDEPSTARLLAGDLGELQEASLAEELYMGRAGGGVVVLRRETYLDCPLDPRFVGWGQEDDAFNLALTALHGTPWRGEAPLVHLWHPPQQRRSRGVGSDAGLRLFNRYKAAAARPDRMRSLVDQASAVTV